VMEPITFAHLVKAMEKIIDEENDVREFMVYDLLAEDMANAAKLVYDACLAGQSYAHREGR